MSQLSFSDQEYSGRKRTTKREEFLKTMNGIIPWTEWVEKIRPFYPSGKRGRPVRGIELMLRMYLLQIWFGLSDEGTEDAIYDSYAMRSFLGLNFMMEQVPDATTLLKFRHLLEEHGLCKALFEDIKARLEKAGLMMHGGTIVDATIIQSTSSTKNKTGERDPEMHQTKKGNQYYHGMKAHIGVDAGSGYVHSLTGTAANAHDITEAHNLIREDDEVIYGDSGYTGIEKRDEIKEDKHLSQIEYKIGRRPSMLNVKKDYAGIDWEREIEHRKASVRCMVEHPFLIVKRQFRFAKTVYRGIRKNLDRLYMLFASANILMCARAGRTKKFRKVCLG